MGGPGTFLEQAFGELQSIPPLRTVSDALRLHSALSEVWDACREHNVEGAERRRVIHLRVWGPELAAVGWDVGLMPSAMQLLISDPARTLHLLSRLVLSLPQPWRQFLAAGDHPRQTAGACALAIQRILAAVGWRLPTARRDWKGGPATSVAIPLLIVRAGTALQSQTTLDARSEQQRAYVRLALEPTADLRAVGHGLVNLRRTLHAAWSLPEQNVHKETLWRLASDGVASANDRAGWRCPGCPTAGSSPRLHCFWECPIAKAVRAELDKALRPDHVVVVSREAVWLGHPPPPSVHRDVWLVVCMAALGAMDHGRRQLWRLHYALAASNARGGRQRTLQELWEPHTVPPPQSCIQRASSLAVCEFWSRLQAFVSAGVAPLAWAHAVGPSHPFLCSGGRALRFPPPIEADQAGSHRSQRDIAYRGFRGH